jgi:hypothetical protein
MAGIEVVYLSSGFPVEKAIAGAAVWTLEPVACLALLSVTRLKGV